MQKIENYESVEIRSAVPELPVGNYLVRIKTVVDKSEYQSLVIGFDIIEGPYKDFFKKIIDSGKTDRSLTWRSYKGNALPIFKRFIKAVEDSNEGYKWNWDEKSLIGKVVCAQFGEEEWLKDDKDARQVFVRVACRCQDWASSKDYYSNLLQLKPRRRLSQDNQLKFNRLKAEYEGISPTPNTAVDEFDNLPF